MTDNGHSLARLPKRDVRSNGLPPEPPERGRRVLVTGGGGYIGCVLVPRLLERGYRVRVLDCLYWGEGPLAAFRDRIELVEADVRAVPSDALDGVEHRVARDEAERHRELCVRALVVARQLRCQDLLELDLAPGHELHAAGDDHRQLADLVVRVQDVEDLAPHEAGLGLQGEDHRVRDIAHVHQRAPHPATAVQKEPLLKQRVLHEGVDHEVVPHARAVAVHRAIAEQDGGQPLARERQQGLLRVPLGGGVRTKGPELRALVVHAERQPVVQGARGGED